MAELAFKFTGNPADADQRPAAGLREVQPVAPSIRMVIEPLNELPPFELVQQQHEPARKDSEHVAELLLAEPGIRAQHPHQAGVMWFELHGGELLFEGVGRM